MSAQACVRKGIFRYLCALVCAGAHLEGMMEIKWIYGTRHGGLKELSLCYARGDKLRRGNAPRPFEEERKSKCSQWSWPRRIACTHEAQCRVEPSIGAK